MENNAYAEISDMDEEDASLALLYRHKKTYGTGLGTAVDWQINDKGEGRIWNDFFPEIEIPSMSFSLPENDLLQNHELSMKYLSDLNETSKEEKLFSIKN